MCVCVFDVTVCSSLPLMRGETGGPVAAGGRCWRLTFGDVRGGVKMNSLAVYSAFVLNVFSRVITRCLMLLEPLLV